MKADRTNTALFVLGSLLVLQAAPQAMANNLDKTASVPTAAITRPTASVTADPVLDDAVDLLIETQRGHQIKLRRNQIKPAADTKVVKQVNDKVLILGGSTAFPM